MVNDKSRIIDIYPITEIFACNFYKILIIYKINNKTINCLFFFSKKNNYLIIKFICFILTIFLGAIKYNISALINFKSQIMVFIRTF